MMSSHEPHHAFQRRGSAYQLDLLRQHAQKNSWSGPPLDTLYAGLSVKFNHENTIVAIAIRDTTYLLDFYEHKFEKSGGKHISKEEIAEFILMNLSEYSQEHMERIMGLAMPEDIAVRIPTLCSRLWHALDIVPIVFREGAPVSTFWSKHRSTKWEAKSLDEMAESMARRCLRFFGPGNNPITEVGLQGRVEVDSAFRIRIASLDDYKGTVGPTTWAAVQHYAADLKHRKVKIAFFSATPQGGGVALMRHALVRCAVNMDVDLKWYVPKPRPGVFRITKTNHNILQGVAAPEERFGPQQQKEMSDWLCDNANRYWVSSGGPLSPPSEGGADIIIVDDPQMPSLIPIAKKIAPNRPVIFRSHIQIRSDLVNTPGTPQAEAWEWLWERIKMADLFISQPVESFVPADIPHEIVGYMPASTDWLDGLNKTMRDWDIAFYGRFFNTLCRNSQVTTIEYPDDQYIIQVARFDPSKGIIDVLDSYAKFFDLLTKKSPNIKPPKLLICGHGSIDDPDGSLIYDEVRDHLREELSNLVDHVCIIRLGPADQVLNALLSKAKIALQLSTREGFEVKVSEAIHKGKPVIASMAGGIPLQVQDGVNGFLVEVGDTDAVAKHLYDLWTDHDLYNRMSHTALNTVSDEVSTVGSALTWLYLASELTKGKTLKPNGRWINDMAREEAGQPYRPEENRLKRAVKVENMK
ncbi:putative trehalose synthase (Ccg-9) [Talaromyces proteolyticus]|uniref:Trehalose synthase (Ccg-9) n=1 Tax=Talaromyces proteolyticus TaxID=1131652 RepID=A0AAD4KN47_9EURO|nr:putative trehalose synthase (Ccg-9) [Talaromyces proteolyticus]KAH8695259.1 putative trehalose synthase (Ccg-9) [Talaromyces proteolyticus]